MWTKISVAFVLGIFAASFIGVNGLVRGAHFEVSGIATKPTARK